MSWLATNRKGESKAINESTTDGISSVRLGGATCGSWYDLSLPIVVRVVQHKRSEPCHSRIRDISACGIYFITDEEFTPGTELEFTVALPVGITQGTEVSMHAHSRVLRAEERREDDTTRTGVAAVIEGIQSIRAEPALS